MPARGGKARPIPFGHFRPSRLGPYAGHTMELRLARYIRECLPQGRTLYAYYKDYYALYLLAQAAGEGTPINALRGSPYGKLLQKPVVKERLAQLGGKPVRRDDFLAHWPVAPSYFRLTLGLWGEEDRNRWEPGWEQTTRPGKNLVLQLNFSQSHNRRFRSLCKDSRTLQYYGHPNSGNGRKEFTLAWARLDVDLDGGEALIEEVQTDWLSYAREDRGRLRSRRRFGEAAVARGLRHMGYTTAFERVDLYLSEVLEAYQKLWDQAMLCAAIWFLREEIGITRIFYHHFDTKCRLLKMRPNDAPPRSLYTALPKAFCFQLQEQAPAMLQRELSKRRTKARCPKPQFYLLTL